jgi:endonuclease III
MTARSRAEAIDGMLAAAYPERAGQARTPPLDRSRDPFRELVTTILSQRTLDANTERAAARLFALAATPEAMVALPEATLAEAIRPANFYRTKARTLVACCRMLLARFGGTVPRAMADLLALPGVGRKTANCVRHFAFGEPALIVDTHVHRVATRLGLVRTASPDAAEARLARRLPGSRWRPFTDLLLEHGKRVCRPINPRCDACVVRALCRRVGVAGKYAGMPAPQGPPAEGRSAAPQVRRPKLRGRAAPAGLR